MGALSKKLMAEVGSTLCRWPQFAYLNDRSCEDALHRVSAHCVAVRATIQQFQNPLHKRAAGLPLDLLGGGITLSLDLSKAFDSVNRKQLFDGLLQLGVSSELIHLLAAIYEKTSFQFCHRNEHRSFPTHRGIRQGCKAAPALWACFAVGILQCISDCTSLEWVLEHLTQYADDLCVHEVVRCPETLHRFMLFLGKILHVLESFHLKINLDKTLALWRISGPLSRKLQKQYVRRTPDGTFLIIPRSGKPHTYVRLVKQFQYLGCTISYHSHERRTMQSRIKASDKTGLQLHRWLHVQRSMTLTQKYKIWKQCVFACLRYGLLPIGLTKSTIQMFDQACMRQLRRIFRDPVHLSHNSHGDFLAAHGLPDPLSLLADLAQQTAQRETQKRLLINQDDIIHHLPPPDFQVQVNLILEVQAQLRSRHLGPDH